MAAEFVTVLSDSTIYDASLSAWDEDAVADGGAWAPHAWY